MLIILSCKKVAIFKILQIIYAYKIIEFSVKNKLIIALLVFGLIGVGAYQVTKLPIDAVPDITNNQVQVRTNGSHLSEQQI